MSLIDQADRLLMDNKGSAPRALDGIDVRNQEDEAGTEIPGGKIEFGLFRNGLYVKSIMLSEAEALKLHAELGKLLDVS